MPAVSVIIPNYNHEAFLSERFRSILSQSFTDFEIIFLDDFSTDGSLSVVESYADCPQLKKIVVNEANSGSPFRQWLKGLSLATGDLVWIAESDDSCSPAFLETLVKEFKKDDSLVLAFCNSMLIDSEGRNMGLHRLHEGSKSFKMKGSRFIKKHLVRNNFVVNASGALFRRDAALAVSDAFASYRGVGDWMFWTEIAQRGKVRHVAKPLNYFRQHGNNTTLSERRSGTAFEENRRLLEYFRSKKYISWLRYSMMKMKLKSLCAALLLFTAASAYCQTSSSDFKGRYDRLVSKLGYDGVGVENLIQKWEVAFPEDSDMLEAKYAYYLTKSVTSNVIELEQDKYLGSAPLLSLKDSLGVSHNYFSDREYDDSLFNMAKMALDKVIKLNPQRLDYRFALANTYIAYEKESPDIALDLLMGLAKYNYESGVKWEYPGEDDVTDELFASMLQDYCYEFFKIGSANSYEAFRSLSELMLKYDRDNPLYLNNLGSYYYVCKGNAKKGLKYYRKVLKKHPDNIPAIKNIIIYARRSKDVALEKKYLPELVKYSSDETERRSAEARLSALK